MPVCMCPHKHTQRLPRGLISFHILVSICGGISLPYRVSCLHEGAWLLELRPFSPAPPRGSARSTDSDGVSCHISHFSHFCGQILCKSNIGKEGPILAWALRLLHLGDAIGWEAAHPIASAVRKQRDTHASARLAFFFVFNTRALPGNGASYIHGGSSSLR